MCLLFSQDFGAEGVDLYDDVISAPSASLEDNDDNVQPPPTNNGSGPHSSPPMDKYQSPSAIMRGDRDGGRRHQLYVGNLTWVIIFKFFITPARYLQPIFLFALVGKII